MGRLHNVTDFDPDRIFTQLEHAAEEWVNAKEIADNLTELKKSLLASLTLENMKTTKSRAEAETNALADQRYDDYVKGMTAAESKAIRAKMRYENLRVLAELRRSEESTRRTMTR